MIYNQYFLIQAEKYILIWRSNLGEKKSHPPPDSSPTCSFTSVIFYALEFLSCLSSVICSLSVQQYIRQLWFRYYMSTGTIFLQIFLNHNCRLVVRCDIYHRKFTRSNQKLLLFAVKSIHVSIIRNIKISNIENIIL